jgi:hypothetical protein
MVGSNTKTVSSFTVALSRCTFLKQQQNTKKLAQAEWWRGGVVA